MLATVLAACALAAAGPAQAQWVWKDANGTRQYSDQPPPASVPPSRILKAPPGQMPDLRKELAGPPPAPAAAPAPVPSRAGPTSAERNADYEQRRKEAAEKAQQAASEAKSRADRAADCRSAQDNQRTLESGIRIATTDARGERVFLDDAQKAEQLRRNRDIIATSCK